MAEQRLPELEIEPAAVPASGATGVSAVRTGSPAFLFAASSPPSGTAVEIDAIVVAE